MDTQILLTSLKKFGLDPSEWTLANKDTDFFESLLLIHKKDPQFRLVGTIGEAGWRKIEVLTL